jgi:glycosyltransferase involved in cell wall biosynthesis
MPELTLSICSGTINRLPGLQHMIQSVRDTVPKTLRYEFVLADNGSTDGTPEWIESQPDCRLVQMGGAVGGVRALSAAGRAAKGKYSMIATDDCAFPPYAIMRAISYLETHLDCGAVQFEDRWLPGYDEQIIWNEHGELIKVPYPQTSMLRTWLGNDCGWWDANGKMDDCYTYAGDNALGYEIYMRGYTVDKVPGVENIAYTIKDDTFHYQRSVNLKDRQTRVREYGDPAHPKPFVQYPGYPMIDNPHEEELRILFINDYVRRVPEWETAKPAFKNAVADCGIAWEHYYKDDPQAPQKLLRAAWALQPHLILSNIHSPNEITPYEARQIRQAAPHAIWLNWIGDVWPKYHLSAPWTDLWKELNGLLVVNADMIRECQDIGIPTYYWQSAAEEFDTLPKMPKWDVVFQGNLHRRAAQCGQRTKLADALHDLRQDGIKVGIYAEQTDDPRVNGNTYWHFDEAQALNKAAKLVVSDNEFCATGYVSKRIWEILITGGGMCLHQETPGFEEYTGLKDGVHYIAWKDYDDLQAKIRYWLDRKQDKRRKQIAGNARRLTLKLHTYPARMRELLTEVLPQMALDMIGERA